MYVLPPLIFNRLDEILDVFKDDSGDPNYGYFKTKQRGFVPVNENLMHPSQYPWMFMEFGGTTDPTYPRTNNMEYIFTLNLIAMTVADKGKIGDLIVSDSLNTNKGILDILEDIGTVLGQYKVSNIGIVEPAGAKLIDWQYGVARPMANMLYMTPQNLSPYIRVIQLDLNFQCREKIA